MGGWGKDIHVPGPNDPGLGSNGSWPNGFTGRINRLIRVVSIFKDNCCHL